MWSAWFTRQMAKPTIGLVMPGLAAGELVGGVALGWLSDRVPQRFSRALPLAVGACAGVGALALFVLGSHDVRRQCGGDTPCERARVTRFFWAAPLFGLMDCAFQATCCAICAEDFGEQSAQAFALFRTWQAAVLCVLFFVTGTQWLSTPDGTVATEQGLVWETLIVVSNLVLAIATWCCYERERAATTGQPTSLPSTV